MTDDDPVRRVRFLRVLPAADRERLLASAERTTLQRGERMWREGEPPSGFAFVVNGRMKLVKAGEDGRDTAIETVAAREMMCGAVVTLCTPYCCSSVAMEDDTEVITLRRTDVLAAFDQSPEVARSLLYELSARSRELCDRIDELSAGQVEQRIAKLLLRLAERSGVERQGQGLWVPIPLTRQDLAELTGTTVETAIRVMSKLRKRSIVSSAPRGFLVQNKRELAAIVAGEVQTAQSTKR